MNFTNWFRKNQNTSVKTTPEGVYDPQRRDYSNIGVDNTVNRTDMIAATGMIYPTVVGSNSVAGMSGFYGGYFNFSGWQGSFPFFAMHSLCRLYMWMAQDPDVRYAIDEIINDSTITDYKDRVVTLNLDNFEAPVSLKEKIVAEFDGVLELMNFDQTAHLHIGDFYTNGRAFYKIDVDKKHSDRGIKAIKQISPFDMIAYFDSQNNVFKDPEAINLSFKEGYIMTENAFRNAYYLGLTNPNMAVTRNQNYYVAVPTELVVYQHSGLLDWRSNVPISYLHLILKTLNQLRNLRDAMVIYRMTRAPERFVFNVEVGKMQPQKAETYVSQVANRVKQTMTYDPETGSFKDVDEKLQIYKDWFFPKVDGKGTDVEVLQAGQMSRQLEEVQEIQKILFRQMFIPYNRYFEEHAMVNFGSDGDSEKMEVKFYKFVKKLQLQFGKILIELLMKQLALKNIVTEKDFKRHLGNKLKLAWGTENAFNESKNAGILRRKGNAIGSFDQYVGKYGITESWVTKNVMGFTEEEIAESEKNMIDELKKRNYIEQITRGTISFDENGKKAENNFGGFGGGSFGGGGLPGEEGNDSVGTDSEFVQDVPGEQKQDGQEDEDETSIKK